MSPRPYRLGRRERGVEETRDRVAQAAVAVFSTANFFEATLEDVAKHAGVARATVYYQFKSKFGLLEAAIDRTVTQAPVDGLRAALERHDPRTALREYVREICRLWERDHVFYRNVVALAALDPEAQRAVDGYDERRREPLVFLGKRFADQHLLREAISARQATDTIWLLTNFRSFDHLRTRMRLSLREAVDVMGGMAQGLLATQDP